MMISYSLNSSINHLWYATELYNKEEIDLAKLMFLISRIEAEIVFPWSFLKDFFSWLQCEDEWEYNITL